MAQKALLAKRRAERIGQFLACRLDADDCQRVMQLGKVAARRIRQHVGGFLGQHLAALVVVEHREPRRHVRLERHQMQQPLAESMNGVDLEPAGRFHRASEQRAGEAELSAARRVPFELRQFGAQALVVHRHPSAEQFEYANRHVGGRRLGEGQTENATRRAAVEQQPHDPVGEHLRLAGARIGRHPCGSARIGGTALCILGVLRDDQIGSHSSPSPLTSDHSLTRARWS